MNNSQDNTSSNSFDDDFSENSVSNNQEQDDLNQIKIIKQGNKKCVNPFITYNQQEAIVNGFKRKPCDNLLCLKCDVPINFFEQSKWDDSCNYMFFRSYFGQKNKLQQKMNKTNNSGAFHCGCTGINVKEVVLINDKNNLKWICCGHQSLINQQYEFNTSEWIEGGYFN